MIKRLFAIVPLALVLVACGLDKTPPAASPEPQPVVAEPDAQVQAVDAQPDAESGEEAARERLDQFMERLASDGKGHIRYSRLRDAKRGGRERQVYVEMVGLTDVEAADAAEKILLDMGYEAGRRWGDENGVRMRFTDVGGIPVDVLARSREAHPLLNHEESTSSVYLTRPVSGE
jgi:hypothetical protein